ncbi:MAG: hypothetical protein K0S55_2115 [Clostridia bacterium]|nr:hypothetical protein [Clostridia bacterium]
MQEMFNRKRISILYNINKQHAKALSDMGFKFAGQLLEKCKTKEQRQNLATDLKIPYEDLYKIVIWCDFARFCGGKQLYYIYESGFHSIDQIINSYPDEIRNQIKDMMVLSGSKPIIPKCCDPAGIIHGAKITPIIIEYDTLCKEE